MRLAETLSQTLSECSPELRSNARDRIDPRWVDEALGRAGVLTVRRRKLPADVVVWMLIGANLVAGYAFDEVVRHLGLTPLSSRSRSQAPPTSSAVSEARARLGDVAMKELFDITAAHWGAGKETASFRFHGLRVLVADGTTFRLPDTASLAAEFGKPSGGRGEAGYPMANALALIEADTHLVIDVELGSSTTAELAMFTTMTPRIPAETLTILDRNFDSLPHLWSLGDAERRRHWMVREDSRVRFRVVQELGPGDQLVAIRVGNDARSKYPHLPREIVARRIRYVAGPTEFTVLTSLLDAAEVPAAEIAALYHSRWEIELAFDDMKTEQRAAATTLRSKSPVGIRQEIYGLLVTHNLVRVEMTRAAALLGVHPTRISFHRALLVVCDHIRNTAAGSPPTKWAERIDLLRSQLQYLLLPERRSDRQYPRAVKVAQSRYPRKRPRARAAAG